MDFTTEILNAVLPVFENLIYTVVDSFTEIPLQNTGAYYHYHQEFGYS